MHFIDNKYTRWYFKIINNPDTSGLCEKHHIIPKSLGGTEVVRLSLRQHFVAHLILTKMVDGAARSKMLFALRCMMNFDRLDRRYCPSSRTFEMLKRQIREAEISEEHRHNIRIGQLGKKLSDHHRAAISQGLIGRVHSEETRNKISLSNKGLKRSKETRAKISSARLGKPLSHEHCINVGNALRGRRASKEACAAIKASQEKFIYTLISPLGENVATSNLKNWCKENNLPYSTFSSVSRIGGLARGWHVSRAPRAVDK
jgi:hypothetical protein